MLLQVYFLTMKIFKPHTHKIHFFLSKSLTEVLFVCLICLNTLNFFSFNVDLNYLQYTLQVEGGGILRLSNRKTEL